METIKPELHVSEMSQDDLDTLANTFTSDGDQYTNFKTLWDHVLYEYPDAETVYSFFEEVEELGYYVKEKVEHPYAKEWGGSHVGVTPGGTPFHMTCSGGFLKSEKYGMILEVIDKAAKDDTF